MRDVSNDNDTGTESDSNKTDFVIEPPSSPPLPPSPTPLPPLGPDGEKPKDPRLRKRKLEDGEDDEDGQITENSWYKDYSAAMQYKAPPKRYLNKVVDLQEQYENVDIIGENGAIKKKQDNESEEDDKEHSVNLEILLTDKDPEKKVYISFSFLILKYIELRPSYFLVILSLVLLLLMKCITEIYR